ncbi:hypothetical protein D3C81_1401950 [compost metagenome]
MVVVVTVTGINTLEQLWCNPPVVSTGERYVHFLIAGDQLELVVFPLHIGFAHRRDIRAQVTIAFGRVVGMGDAPLYVAAQTHAKTLVAGAEKAELAAVTQGVLGHARGEKGIVGRVVKRAEITVDAAAADHFAQCVGFAFGLWRNGFIEYRWVLLLHRFSQGAGALLDRDHIGIAGSLLVGPGNCWQADCQREQEASGEGVAVPLLVSFHCCSSISRDFSRASATAPGQDMATRNRAAGAGVKCGERKSAGF